MRKKIFSVLFLLLIFSNLIICLNSFCTDGADYAEAQSRAEIAMELETGTVLSESNADARLPMASTTKIMTAILIIEDCDLDKIVAVPNQAVGVEGSSIYLKNDEQINIRDLLYGLMLRSGNDSATALAIIHSGSVEKFVKVMNERAKLIGAKNTNFCNPSGLPNNNHYTTAIDLCNIARYAMKNPTFKQIVSTKSYEGQFRSFVNKNKILTQFDGANGVKTGYTVNAGRCLVSSAERDGMDVVCVVLNCPEMYERSMQILENCFNNFSLVKIEEDKVFMCGDVLCKIKDSCVHVVKKSESIYYETELLIRKTPKKAGELVGKLNILSKNGLLFSENLYSI